MKTSFPPKNTHPPTHTHLNSLHIKDKYCNKIVLCLRHSVSLHQHIFKYIICGQTLQLGDISDMVLYSGFPISRSMIHNLIYPINAPFLYLT